jgi:hypothetical protein
VPAREYLIAQICQKWPYVTRCVTWLSHGSDSRERPQQLGCCCSVTAVPVLGSAKVVPGSHSKIHTLRNSIRVIGVRPWTTRRGVPAHLWQAGCHKSAHQLRLLCLNCQQSRGFQAHAPYKHACMHCPLLAWAYFSKPPLAMHFPGALQIVVLSVAVQSAAVNP